jgi:murein DD-endopeptidase MepM/ murein hydrolase activator NlpD
MHRAVIFLNGFIAGMLFLLLMLWSHGSLQPVRAAARLATESRAAPPELPAKGSRSEDVPNLIVPVAGADISKMIDTFDEKRGSHRHEATDIMAPRGTPVLAAGDGTIVKLFFSRAGGVTIYQFDPSQTWCYYYAHLDRYAPNVEQGIAVKQGQTIGYVGSTGDASAEAPHLHFEIHLLGPGKKWWHGTAIDPYPILLRNAPK